MTSADDLVPALAEHLVTLDEWTIYNVGEGDMTQQELCQALAKKALAFVAERLPTEDHVDELVKRAWTGACPHGKKKLGPCRSCSILRIRNALLRDLRERLSVKDG